jgi:hypothetical protein
VGFFGLDVYSLWESLYAVLAYLRKSFLAIAGYVLSAHLAAIAHNRVALLIAPLQGAIIRLRRDSQGVAMGFVIARLQRASQGVVAGGGPLRSWPAIGATFQITAGSEPLQVALNLSV